MSSARAGNAVPGIAPRIHVLAPLAEEWSILVKACEARHPTRMLRHLKVPCAYVPQWRLALAQGGHGKTQMAVQGQYLIDRFPGASLIVCAGATRVPGWASLCSRGGEVQRFADHPALLSCSRADQITDDDQTAGDAEPDIQSFRRRELADRIRISDAAMISADDLAQILRIETRRQRGGPDQIAEHDLDVGCWKRLPLSEAADCRPRRRRCRQPCSARPSDGN
jgi:hypothetical protein